MTKDQRIVRAVGAAYSLNKKRVIEMLNANGASIKSNASNDKVLKTLKGFLTSNDKFAKEFMVFVIDKGYLSKKDLVQEGTLSGKDKLDYNNFYDAIISEGVGLVKGIFAKPEADQETIKAIMELEKAKIEASKQSNAKYWVAGAAVFGALLITGIIIYKKKR
jgi:hypothetical protein